MGMDFAGGPPTRWLVTLADGSVIEIWADGYSEEDGVVVFSVLVDATAEEQQVLEVTGRTPSRPERVIITVARIPVTAMREPPWSA